MAINILKGPKMFYFACQCCGTEFSCLASDCTFNDSIWDRTWSIRCPTCERVCFYTEKRPGH